MDAISCPGARKEAGHAFIKSQTHEGWIAVADDYDDGGFSGGNMERPALKRLLADIEAGRIDIVVVYKIDRLSRSLADFARMVEVFDCCGVSFSAITQQINSATSMGRLMSWTGSRSDGWLRRLTLDAGSLDPAAGVLEQQQELLLAQR